MPSKVALLGATGQAGQEVLKQLLDKDIDINIYVRSKSKLFNLFPDLDSNPRVHVYEGDISNTTLIKQLLTNIDTIIFTLGWNDNRPGPTIIEDGARAVTTALRDIHNNTQEHKKQPRLIFLSSASWNKKLNGDTPPLQTRMIRLAFHHPYQDLLAGQKILLADPSLLTVTLIQPGALIEEQASGYDIGIDTVGVGCSYPDLGAAMVEVALDERYKSVAAVMVTSKAGYEFGRYAGVVLPKVVMGLAASLVPGFWTVYDLLARLWSR
ncbi:unnamed protein product [Aureobasidium uvarum]|uniref:NAD(P)-binding domain-containing protein n=1 Tax=Aureobasidium uvarum TaxID=2773716 RepID=A0A9N8KEM1_9PEZI|nr:unnamed protein product [Aureobasidium uvarum]